jgi:rubrerythrin
MTRHDLAAPELAAIDVQGVTRQAFMVRGTIAVGAVYGLSTVSPFVRSALAEDGGGDLEILNFALTLEYLEAAIYEQALRQVRGLPSSVRSLAEEIGANENVHVKALTGTIKELGGKPVKAPGVDFGDAFSSPEAFLRLAQTFEDTGVGAYNGAAPAIRSKEVLGAAGSIVQVEARHAAAIRGINGEQPAEGAFDAALGTQEVLTAVQPFVKS